ncbi:MAG: M48 family metallopeptidase [Clostridia bacterium]|nr:M48 family metallopeptidase [Clostridia bacterium]MBR0537191.1 M48 family metallopeptidase [Clostridia bacterium]
MEKEYQLIRSDRKTVGLQIKKDGSLVVRAPYGVSEREIERLVREKRDWIEKHRTKIEETRAQTENVQPLTYEELQTLAERALAYIPQRVRYYAPKVGVTYGRITIRNQKSRWGSCSAKGNLNFNCLLMLTPPEVIDSVVVHELCHRKEMNHSPRFYAEVRRVFPEYDRWNKWLKQNGAAIMEKNKS